MVSVPFQNNFDFGGGPNGDGFQWKMNVQPVIPLSVNDDWTADQFTMPFNLSVSKMFNIGEQKAQWYLGARYYADKGALGPEWGLRAGVTLLFPK